MDRWLRAYDNSRLNPDAPITSMVSSKYSLEDYTWTEIKDVPVPELECNFGPACQGLRKSWYAYNLTKKSGDYAGDLALRINRIQKALGFPLAEFPELDSDWVGEELSIDEKQLKAEEEQEEAESWEGCFNLVLGLNLRS